MVRGGRSVMLLTVPAGCWFAGRRIRLLNATSCYVPGSPGYDHAGLMSWLSGEARARDAIRRLCQRRSRTVNGRLHTSVHQQCDFSSQSAFGANLGVTEPPLTATTARAVVNRPTSVPNELWAQAAALLSAGLEDD